jgi:histidinol-phosphate/aromatic aminotransferase/cobyric acid decarboxylase-like protein
MVSIPQSFPHGGGVEAAAKAWGCDTSDIVDLSAGLHPLGAPTWLADWLSSHADLVERYPDVQGEPARSEIADDLGVNVENVWIVAGAQAVIEVIFQALRWKSMAIEVPCYHEPIRCAQRAGCEAHAFEKDDAIPTSEVLWHTSPSNPFGIKKDFPLGYSGVLDESYMLFSERRALGLMDGVIRLGSLTKTFCIPGLRLGYVVADAAVIQQLRHWLSPWSVSTQALHILPKLLQEADMRDAYMISERERLSTMLRASGWEVLPSQGAFVLAKPIEKTPDFKAHKLLVRSFSEWPQLSGWYRFGIPRNTSAWNRLSEALLCL